MEFYVLYKNLHIIHSLLEEEKLIFWNNIKPAQNINCQHIQSSKEDNKIRSNTSILQSNTEREVQWCAGRRVFLHQRFPGLPCYCHSLRGDKERESWESYSVKIGMGFYKTNRLVAKTTTKHIWIALFHAVFKHTILHKSSFLLCFFSCLCETHHVPELSLYSLICQS